MGAVPYHSSAPITCRQPRCRSLGRPRALASASFARTSHAEIPPPAKKGRANPSISHACVEESASPLQARMGSRFAASIQSTIRCTLAANRSTNFRA